MFQPIVFALDNALYHQTKTLIGFWFSWRLNSRSLIQPSETLSIELTGDIQFYLLNLILKKN